MKKNKAKQHKSCKYEELSKSHFGNLYVVDSRPVSGKNFYLKGVDYIRRNRKGPAGEVTTYEITEHQLLRFLSRGKEDLLLDLHLLLKKHNANT